MNAHPPIHRILVCCAGNRDRSPFVAAILRLLAKNAGCEVTIESAGTLTADEAGPDTKIGLGALEAGRLLGFDFINHTRRCVSEVSDLDSVDLFIAIDGEVAGRLLRKLEADGYGIPKTKTYNVLVHDAWPVHFIDDYERVTVPEAFMAAYRVMKHYGPRFHHPEREARALAFKAAAMHDEL